MSKTPPTITTATITAQPKQLGDPMPEVHVEFSDGSARKLFTYFPDEISFKAKEFVGMTAVEALSLKHDRDVAYLRS
jgi:hypothetical protein